MNELPTIAAAIASIRHGALTPTDLVEHCLSRIEQFDEQIRAWVLVDAEGARREAELLTQGATSGEIVGPLHGIPVGIKDIIDVAGMPTKAGSALRNDIAPAEEDAPVIAALRKAGAIILGKTVTTEWACFDPPPTRNPWNLDRTPGGSSSGSAAAVASQMCMAALGTQTGGSIIRPAAYCGVAGLKPTCDSLPMDGIVPVSFHLDHVGPLARNVSDLHAMYWGMMGRETTSAASTRPPTMCRVDEYFLERTNGDVLATYESVIEKLSKVEWKESLPLPASFAELHECHRTIMAVDAAHVHREAFAQSRDAFGPNVTALMEEGRATSTMDYIDALRHRHDFREDLLRLLQSSPILVMPSTPSTAPGPETTGDARFNSPWSYCGFPAVTIPCGLGASGLPVGLQMVGAPNCDQELLSAAAWCEERIDCLGEPTFINSA